MRLRRLKQNGDTIVEVLICLAVLGFILAISYSIATRAQQSIRSSQERIEALKLAEGQLEQLKSAQKNNTPVPFATIAAYNGPRVFCFDNSGLPQKFAAGFSLPSLETDNFNYKSECSSLPQPGGLYNVTITGPGNAAGGDFTVRVRWQHLGSSNRDEVKLEYKIYGDN